MNGLLELICLLLHAPRTLELFDSRLLTTDEGEHNSFNDCLGSNQLAAEFSAAVDGTGRIGGVACGCSNLFLNTNYTSIIRARFRHYFAIDPADLVGGDEHEFEARVDAAGVFEHLAMGWGDGGWTFAEKPTDDFASGWVRSLIRAYEVQSGNQWEIIARRIRTHYNATVTSEDLSSERIVVDGHIFREFEPQLDAVQIEDEPISLRFTPSGDVPVIIRVENEIRARVRGQNSRTRVVGLARLDDFFQVTLNAPTVRVIPGEDSVCAEILG